MTKDWVGGMLGTPLAKRQCIDNDANGANGTLPFLLNTSDGLSIPFSPIGEVNTGTPLFPTTPLFPPTPIGPIPLPSNLAPPQDTNANVDVLSTVAVASSTNDEEVHADEEIKQIADGIKKDIKEDIEKEVDELEPTTTIEQNPAISLADLKVLKPYLYELIINVWMFVMIMAFNEIDVLKKSESIYKNLCVWVGSGSTKGKKRKTTTDQSKALFTTFKRGCHKSFKHEGKASSKKENCIPLLLQGKTQVTDYPINKVFILLKDLPQFLELGKINAMISHLLLPVSTESKKE